MMDLQLDNRRVGEARPYRVKHLDGEARQFQGWLLGEGSSRLESHIHPLGDPPPGLRCSGCRWVEARIWWSQTDQCYVIGIKGHTSIDGEQHRYKSWWAVTPEGVLDALLVKPPARRAQTSDSSRELPQANYAALEQAAERDPALARVLDAWEDHQ